MLFMSGIINLIGAICFIFWGMGDGNNILLIGIGLLFGLYGIASMINFCKQKYPPKR